MIREHGRLLVDPDTLTDAELRATPIEVTGTLVSAAYITAMDYSGANPIYIGLAIPGSTTDGESWQVRKLTYSGDNLTLIQYAGGSAAFANTWDGRAGYSYS